VCVLYLQIFSAAEMDVMLCGERSIEWDKASLQQHIKLVSNELGQFPNAASAHAFTSASH
jgi:hypothetical protein